MSATSSSIPSAQVIGDDQPRFRIPAVTDDPAWAGAAAEEAAGGVAAEVRVFLDAQLAGGDVVLDAAPGFGFVALSATTAPGGMPSVFVCGLSPERLQPLQDAAIEVGGWLDELPAADLAQAAVHIEGRLEDEGRVFVHVDAARTAGLLPVLAPLLAAERVLAICVSDAAVSPSWPAAAAALEDAGFAPCHLVEKDGEPVVLPLSGAPDSPVIALPAAMFLADDAAADHASTPVVAPTPAANGATAPRTWSPSADGLVFSAPHSRTGYGVVGAHLLQALQARGVPVSFRCLGPLDRTMTNNSAIDAALATTVGAGMPSVLLNQQFLLTDHVGTGPRVGFTIFERDRFTDDERRQMQAQDALVVCSAWARDVCRANGITVPVHVVPLGVDRTVFHEQVSAPQRFTDTVFLQVGKLEVRKGQLDLLRAFEAAFSPADPVRLVLHCRNPFISAAELEAQLAPFRASPMRDRITLVTSELATSADVAQLMAVADCGVFAARAEGWNLEALEMLSMGKTVIATNVTAHTEFLTPANARLIDIDAMEPAMGGALPGAWAAWGTAQHEQLVSHLRAVHAERQAGTLARNDAGVATATRFSWAASAEALVAVLHTLAGRGD